jgi:hypothetical protein
VGNASKAGEGTADGAEEEMLIVGKRVFGDNQSTVKRDIDRLGEFGRAIVRI